MSYKLILLLNELDQLSSLCNKCGMCQMHCPVFLETKNGSDVARGKLTLINGIASEILKQPDQVLKRLNNCLLCGSCSSGCSRNVNTIEIFIKARIIITEFTGLPTIKKMLLKQIIAHPKVFSKTTNLIKSVQHLFFKTAVDVHNSITPRLYMPFLRGRQLQPLAPKTFHSLLETRDKTNPEERKDTFNVIFFAGCLIDKIMPEIGLSCVEVLEHHNVNVHIFSEEGCCGIPALSSGDIGSFTRLIEHNTKVLSLENIDYIVTACATCTYTISKLWPMIYKGDKQPIVSAIADKTIDITQFIALNFLSGNSITKKLRSTNQSIVTIHDPCHSKKSLNISSEPRTLVNENSEYRLEEMESPDSCCGFGGTFNLTNYRLSSEIGKKKCALIEDTEATTVATSCPACMLQLKDQLAKNKKDIQVKHVIEIYSDALK